MSVPPKISTRILISSDFHWYGTRKPLFMTALDLKFLIRMQGRVCERKTHHSVCGSMITDFDDVLRTQSQTVFSTESMIFEITVQFQEHIFVSDSQQPLRYFFLGREGEEFSHSWPIWLRESIRHKGVTFVTVQVLHFVLDLLT